MLPVLVTAEINLTLNGILILISIPGSPGLLVFQANSNYISTRLTPQGKMFPAFFVNMGIRQDLWKRKASLILTVSDVFNTLRNNSEVNTLILYEKTIRRRSPRIIYTGFVFNFGKSNEKQKEEQLKFENQ